MATNPTDVFGGLVQAPDISSLFGDAGPPPSDVGAVAPAQVPGTNSPSISSITSYARGFEAERPPVESAIDKLKPDGELHRMTLEKLDAMWDFGKKQMQQHYSRWNYAEQRVQAFTSMPDYERLMEDVRVNNAVPPEPVSVIVPYSYATLHAAATFVHQVLVGRKPIFPLLATRGTETERARRMEIALQSNLDASRGQETLWQLIWDPLIYGFGAIKNSWEERFGQTVRWIGGRREMARELNFAGNVLAAVDPYAFIPDPRVPIHQCNIRGDFMFSEMPLSRTVLKDMEKDGSLRWVNEGLEKEGRANSRITGSVSENRRRVKIGVRGEDLITPDKVAGFVNVREGTVRLVPKDWKLGTSDRSELWKFSWMKGQIIQAEPLGMIHNQHPMTASEPTTFGHDFMSVAMHDMIGPFQDILSWLVSSRMENVRAAINNQFVADPARVDINDIRSSAIGRIVRLKQTAMGLDVREAIMQLQVVDVTTNHLTDIQTMRILADTITGVNDNLRGINTSGGRRSATEARQSMQAGAQRLSQLAVRISAQALQPLVQQMIMNIQQFMPDKMWVEITGDDGMPSSQAITPDMIVGSYNYQISDGSLPYDKTALMEVWKEMLFGIAQDPELRQTWSLPDIFRYVAELGGAKNIDSFKKQALPAPAPGAAPPVEASAVFDPGNMPGMTPIGPAMPPQPM